MKSDEYKEQVKSLRKAATDDIEAGLIAELKKLAVKLGQKSKHFQKEVEKGSKRLAKKLSKEMEFEVPDVPVAPINTVKDAEKPAGIPKKEKVEATPTAVVAPVVMKRAVKRKTAATSAEKDTKPV